MAKNAPKKNMPGSRAEQKASTEAKREARREKAARQAAAAKAEAARRKRRERLIVGGVVAAVLALIVGGVLFQVNRTSAPALEPANATDTYGFSIGEDDAETQIDIYADYLCPACASFEAAVDPSLVALAEAGAARVTYYPVVILDRYGDYSERAGNAVAAVLDTAGPEVAAEYNRNLFAQQPSEGQGGYPDNDWLIDLAVESGAEESEIREAVEDGSYVEWLKRATQESEKRGLRGTPTIFIDDEQLEPDAAAARIAELSQALPEESDD
ncbi:thioredoxin domain-containing protein [Nocardioides sp. Y6]|uniref:Thioredoxin domain-containing protein n=1 Tax=Nocardioides malaquae TaxID=2773426 RepID=A0ABR9RQ84_9ACTN|nr:thioredoxin domain-containing protein [Nocardioides malaquae]MBE7323728.1 thioredoxin domain-containing protein [Nocardioides malaquae]